VLVLPDAPALFRAAADEVIAAAQDAIARRGRFTIALSGGHTPRGLYTTLAAGGDGGSRIAWDHVHLFWGDERHVPPDHPDSNYRMAREALLDRVAVPPANVHRIPAEDPDAARAAARYEEELRRFFELDGTSVPRFDLVLLGLGRDGHTASLFPGTAALADTTRLVVAAHVPALGTDRITLTLPVLNHAACALFLVSGPEKAAVVHKVLEEPGATPLPAQRIRPAGRLVWLLDAAAAATR
jgi:6-phosphogluconolactonase